MTSIGQENLETVMIDFFGALRRGDFEAAAEVLDPEVSWQGLREEWVCHGRARDCGAAVPLGLVVGGSRGTSPHSPLGDGVGHDPGVEPVASVGRIVRSRPAAWGGGVAVPRARQELQGRSAG